MALSQHGFVEQSGRRGAYRLGPAIYALANKSHGINDMVNFFRPALIGISAETGLSSYLMARSGLDSVCLDFSIGSSPIQALFEGVGGRLPLGVGLGGVSVLAQMDEVSRAKIIEINQPRYRQWSVGIDTITAEIAMLQRDGFAIGMRRNKQTDIKTIAFSADGAAAFNSQAGISLLVPNEIDEERVASIVSTVRKHLA